MKKITVNPNLKKGKIKPLHGVGGGPVSGNFSVDARKEFREAGIPFARTHDIEYPYGSGEFVDIHCIFPNFDADVNDPKSYNFVFTDAYLQYCLDAGTMPFYRLGTSIEHQPIKRYIYAPKDYTKWAEICSHIIAHYNEKWADGFEMGIEYWEIWNEPDLKNRCWIGSDESFFELYDVAATLIKREHPYVKIGGCAITWPGSPMAEGFLKHVQQSKAPLDFFSWHGYVNNPYSVAENSKRVENMLNQYGFPNAESIYDEWNYVVDWKETLNRAWKLHKTSFCAAHGAAILTLLQNSRTDKAMYYDVQSPANPWNGVFTSGKVTEHGEMHGVICEKPYYFLKGWNELYKAGTYLHSTAEPKLFVAAATDTDEKEIWVYVSYFDDPAGFGDVAPETDEILFDIGKPYQSAVAYVTDDEKTNEEIPLADGKLTMKGNSFAVVKFTL